MVKSSPLHGIRPAEISTDFKISEYKSWTEYPDHPASEWDIGKVKQIAAGRTTFTALSEAGEVWTWGDERYQACLGRDIGGNGSSSRYLSSAQSTANESVLFFYIFLEKKKVNSLIPSHSAAQPGLVTDLQSLPTGPITKVASGGYITAALTAEHDLYLWGVDEFLHLDGQPTPLDLEDSDILDVGVGDSHVIILTLDRRVLVIGKGENGQLGLGEGAEELREWREVDLALEAGWRPLQVVAGPRCSFVLVSNET
jgi:alpha-tubulin suppressor-like RCC1 family protein